MGSYFSRLMLSSAPHLYDGQLAKALAGESNQVNRGDKMVARDITSDFKTCKAASANRYERAKRESLLRACGRSPTAACVRGVVYLVCGVQKKEQTVTSAVEVVEHPGRRVFVVRAATVEVGERDWTSVGHTVVSNRLLEPLSRFYQSNPPSNFERENGEWGPLFKTFQYTAVEKGLPFVLGRTAGCSDQSECVAGACQLLSLCAARFVLSLFDRAPPPPPLNLLRHPLIPAPAALSQCNSLCARGCMWINGYAFFLRT
ncbi:hypothetical protein CEXT_458121 [Caerostris extrusa]|uniref:Uncharacterized protein n=1 Tax=Caerostris extrusa TaxID=172846 RepID=A0AAV4WUV8_CAEEX|nr:hypothetical protein CEXT_458121 [Caerostris extrusa]